MIRRDGSEEVYGKISRIALEKGDLIRLATATGGGWGDPAERDAARVRDDLRDGFITAEVARRVYGVEARDG